MGKTGSIAIFAGSSSHCEERYKEEAEKLGTLIAKEGITLVYGGGSLGIMAVAATAAYRRGGEVIGVLPEIFNNERVLKGENTTRLIITKDMHERKARMYALADAFIVLPGGIGTAEEFFEVFTWKQIGYHHKNIVLLNTGGFYDTLLSFLGELEAKNFLSHEVLSSLKVASSAEEAMMMVKEAEEDLPQKV